MNLKTGPKFEHEMTENDHEILRLKKEYAELEKRIAKLEAQNLAAARKAGHDSDGNLIAAV